MSNANICKCSDAVMDVLKQHEVEYVFGIPGATEVHFMESLEAHPEIQYILGLNEMVCVGAAEGYARSANKPAFLNLHTAPGLAAALPLLLNARYGKVPMVITVGQNDTRLLSKDPQLSGDIAGIAKPVVKWSEEVHVAENVPVVLNRAFKLAMQAPMGPVVVSLPYDLMSEEISYQRRELPPMGYPAGRGDAGLVKYAAELLGEAKNPVLFVQEGVARSRAMEETVKFAELVGFRVYQVWMGDVNFPTSHPLYMGDMDSTSPKMREVLESCDLFVGIGCQFFNDAFYSGIEMPLEDKKIIQIDDDPWEIGKNFHVDCGIQGNIKSILTELNQLLEANEELKAVAAERLEALKPGKAAELAKLQEKIAAEKEKSPLAISAVMDAINQVVDEDTLIVDDCWSSSGLLRQILELKKETQLYRPRNGGSIGFGVPGGLGVKMANPDKKVFVVSGDGSAAWSMQTFWTAAHYDIPVVFLITNNGTYRQVKNVRKRILGDYPLDERHLGMEIDNPRIDFCALAGSMGVEGCKAHNYEELKAALAEHADSQHPYLIELYVENPAQ